MQPKMVKNPYIGLKVTMSGERTGRDGGKISSIEDVIIKIAPVVNLAVKSFRNTGPFSNTGAIPPKADTESTYTINWVLTNTTSDLKSTVVKASLPPGVSWKGEISPSSEKITYDPNTRMVTWDIGNVLAGTGFTNSAKQVYFKVGIVPSLSQVGSMPDLATQIRVTSVDTHTGSDIKLNGTSATTRFSDTSFSSGQDVVVN